MYGSSYQDTKNIHVHTLHTHTYTNTLYTTEDRSSITHTSSFRSYFPHTLPHPDLHTPQHQELPMSDAILKYVYEGSVIVSEADFKEDFFAAMVANLRSDYELQLSEERKKSRRGGAGNRTRVRWLGSDGVNRCYTIHC